jgi:RHS repeat-associated protein
MPQPTVSNGGETIATKGTRHAAMATSPDVCKVPPSPKPEPLPNWVRSEKLQKGATTTTFIAGFAVWTEVGELGPTCLPEGPGNKVRQGVSSGVVHSKGVAGCSKGSQDVFFEGHAVVRTTDPTIHNAAAASGPGNTLGKVVFVPDDADLEAMAWDAVGGAFTIGHPVDVVTGRVSTDEEVDVALAGPLPLDLGRCYSSRIADRDVGFGWGWASSIAWEIELGPSSATVLTGDGILVPFEELPAVGEAVLGPAGWVLRRERDGFSLDTGQRTVRRFGPIEPGGSRFCLLAIEDLRGNRIEIRREAQRLTSVVDSAGRVVRLVAGDDGRVRALEVNDGVRWIRRAAFSYDAAGHLVAVTDALGHARRYRYDAWHRLVAETDRCGVGFHFVYDARGRCIETWGELPEGDESLVPDRPTTLADGRTPVRGVQHFVLRYFDDGSSEVVDVRRVRRFRGHSSGVVAAGDEGHGHVEKGFDAGGFVASQTDAGGFTQRVRRDARGRAREVVDKAGGVARAELDARGCPVEITAPNGGRTRIVRDAAGAVVATTDANGATASYRYDARGLTTEIVQRSGHRIELAYDEAGNLVRATRPNGAIDCFEYDGLGRVVGCTDALGATTRFRYSDRGELVEQVGALGHVVRYEHDPEGRPTRVTQADGTVTTFGWGLRDRLARATDGAGRSVRLRYDLHGALASVEDEAGKVYRFEYDEAGRHSAERDYDGTVRSAAYDVRGLPVRLVGPLGATENHFDALGRCVARKLPDGSREELVYDAAGWLVSARNGACAITVERDALGRVVRETQDVGGVVCWVESRRDADGRRLSLRTSLGHVEQTEISPDFRTVRTVIGGSAVVTRRLDAIGREVARELDGGGVIERRYDALRRLAEARVRSAEVGAGPEAIGWRAGGTTVRTSWEYEAQRLVARHDAAHGAVRYATDAGGRLVGAGNERFGWDACGNLFPEGQTRAYDGGNRLLTLDGTRYRWDAEGQLIEKSEAGGAAWRYQWDGERRLRIVECPGDRRVELDYDPLGRRLKKAVIGPDGARTTRYVWDGDTVVHEIVDDGRERVERTYCYEPGSIAPAAQRMRRDGPWLHCVNDPNGAPRRLVTGGGEVAREIDVRAFDARPERAKEPAATPFGMLGHWHDEETGLAYVRYRYYDPRAGRFISPDPAGLEGNTNGYAYPADPIRRVDPLGLQERDNDTRYQSYSYIKYGYLPTPDTYAAGPRTLGGFMRPWDKAGTFTLNAHGDPDGMEIPPKYDTFGPADGWTENDADIEKWLKNQVGYKAGMPIRLASCNTGKKINGGIAQRLAMRMGAPVTAPTEFLASNPYGMSAITKDGGFFRTTGMLIGVVEEDGVWRTFYPDGTYSDKNTPRTSVTATPPTLTIQPPQCPGGICPRP